MSKTYSFETFQTRAALQFAATQRVEHDLRDAIARRGSAVFMCSGGSTPGPVYEALSETDLDWSAVQVGLADERWVDEDHSGSNGALVRRTLLKSKAAHADFIPMKTTHTDPFDAVEEVAERYAEALFCDSIILGMGPDAHTLSWFPEARGLDMALDPSAQSPVAAIEAQKSEVTGDNLLRMTLTLPCIAEARSVLLLITGERKRTVFETAGPDTPVSQMCRAAGRSLSVLYAD